ncbi:MAG: GGDEF domain-containing protein [Clostridiales bacterium]|nr:GGDEF domain-containing protein [Clostridiales bacterium]
MDFISFVNMIDIMTCIISVETKDDGSYGEIRIVTGNAPYIASIENVDESAPQMLTNKFIPNSLYENYFPKDLNFEDFCYRCAVLKQPMHTYVHPDRYDFWFNLYMIPLGNKGNIHYCTYSQVLTKSADSSEMSNTSASIATDVLNTCIKLRGATNFQHTMDEVISDIRKLCDAQSCVILLTDHETRTCRALCESRNEYSMLPSMKGVLREGFYDLTLSWKDTIGGSNCLIAKNKNEWDYVKEKNPAWYESLMKNHVDSIVLFPLTFNDEILGYIWACNFDTESTVKIKQTLELTTFFVASEIGNQRLLERLKKLSSMDMLTGVMNRNEMNNTVDSLRMNSDNSIKGLGIVFADLNGLKRVNDNEGHAAGDLLIKNAAIALQNAFIGDQIFRAGGDEFMILLSFTTEEAIIEMCNKAKQLSRHYDNLSFALGYCYQNDSSDITGALKLADERMYEDKEKYYKQHPELKR